MNGQHRQSEVGLGSGLAGGENVGPGDQREHGREMVSITVNNEPVAIHRGSQLVSEIKRLGGVPAADELAQVIPGQPLKPLADDGSVVIKGGEEFVSYPKDSSSSFAPSGLSERHAQR